MGRMQEVEFANDVGRFYARQYAMPPMTGTVLGWLMVCDPPQQTAAEIAEALGASRSAVGSAITMLDSQHMLRRSRVPGTRREHISLDPASNERSLDTTSEFFEMGQLGRRGLRALVGTPRARQARLLEAIAFSDFLTERTSRWAEEWREHRQGLIDSGELPDPNDSD